MSTDISLLLEFSDGGHWAPALHVADRLSDPRVHLGIVSVCWWSARSCPTSLFFGENAVIPFNAGLPDDLSPAVNKYVRPNFEDDMTYAGWISLADLDLESWNDEHVIVGGPVKAQYVPLFKDGRQPPPIEALLHHGVANPVLERVTNWESKQQFECSSIPDHRLRNLPSDSLVNVTWVESLADFAGCIWEGGLAGLVGIEDPDLYRVVTAVG